MFAAHFISKIYIWVRSWANVCKKPFINTNKSKMFGSQSEPTDAGMIEYNLFLLGPHLSPPQSVVLTVTHSLNDVFINDTI